MRIRSHIYFHTTTEDNIRNTHLSKHTAETADLSENKNSQTKHYAYGWMPAVPITLETACHAI